jgi:hypothetical protein
MYNSNIFSKGTSTFKDIDISFLPHPFTGDLRTKEDVDSIKQSLMSLIYTNFGERPFNPLIGGGLNHLLFEQLDEITYLDLQSAIKRIVSNWEPRIELLNLNIKETQDNNQLDISLYFNIVNYSEPQSVNILLKRIR